MRCPECNRVLINEECSIHGKVKGNPDLRVKLIVDDGTGAVDSVLNKQLSEKILGIKLEDSKKMSSEDLLDEINTKLFSRRIVLKGNALGDEFGTTVITKDAELTDIDIEKETEKLSKEIEEIL